MSNQFKLLVFRNRNAAAIEGVPTFDIGRLQVNDRIGQGSFGEVFTTDFRFPSEHAAETVVVKKALGVLDDEEKKLFLKEVALLNKLNHSNVGGLRF